jgi:hypothetical protein
MVPLLVLQCDVCKLYSKEPADPQGKLPPTWTAHKRAGITTHVCGTCGTDVQRAVHTLLTTAKGIGWTVSEIASEFRMENPRWSQ